MQSRFGLKDFVLLVLMLVIGLSVWLAMFQRDREWEQIQEVRAKLIDMERLLGRTQQLVESDVASRIAALDEDLERIQSTLDSGVVARTVTDEGAGGERSASPASRSASWARPDVPIQWQEPWTYATDPRESEHFQTGGEFTEVFEAQPAKLVPYIQTDVYGRRVVDLVSESLGAYDPKTLRLRGQLADAWQYAADGMWLRVHINPRARFSDGTPVTAEDVRWTFHDFVMNPQIEAERTRAIIADVIERVDVIDDKTVEFVFKDAFFSNLDSALGLFILPKHFYSRFSPSEINQSTGLLMGSGPYKLASLSAASQWAPPAPVVLVRNEQYWGSPRPLASIRFKAIDNELARLTEYKNDAADMITPSSPQFVTQTSDPEWLKNNQALKWINMRSGRAGIIWNCGERNGKLTPFHDKRVRQAMTMLLDRERMIRDIWQGIGEVANGFANPGTLGHDPKREPWPYDPARAMALLKEAGWEDRNGDRLLEDAQGNPFVFEFTYFGGGEIGERIATFVKDSYAAAGIRVTLRQMDWSVGEPVRNQRDFDAMVMGWGANAPESDPKQIFHSESIKNQGDNFAQWSNPEADRAIDMARKELDEEKRAKLWEEFERVLHEDQPYTWVRVAPFIRFIKPDVGNVNTYPKGLELWEFYKSPVALPTAGL